jgi:hypothetical protein
MAYRPARLVIAVIDLKPAESGDAGLFTMPTLSTLKQA